MGKKGGMMDAKDDLTQNPIDLITNPALQVNNPNSPIMATGMTLFRSVYLQRLVEEFAKKC